MEVWKECGGLWRYMVDSEEVVGCGLRQELEWQMVITVGELHGLWFGLQRIPDATCIAHFCVGTLPPHTLAPTAQTHPQHTVQ